MNQGDRREAVESILARVREQLEQRQLLRSGRWCSRIETTESGRELAHQRAAIRRLANLGRWAEERTGFPLDIEFGFDAGGSLLLFQVRPAPRPAE